MTASAETHGPILAIASAGAGAAIALVQDGEVLRARRLTETRGLPSALAEAVAALLDGAPAPVLVAAVVGPGSFTGLRAGLALAHGVGLGAGLAVVGVTLTEALAEALPNLGGRALWVATQARPGRLFLDRGEGPVAIGATEVPRAAGRVAVAGDAATLVAATLAARGEDAMLTSARHPLPRHVALVGARRAAGLLPPLPALPLYVDAPEAKLPAGGLRPAPV